MHFHGWYSDKNLEWHIARFNESYITYVGQK